MSSTENKDQKNTGAFSRDEKAPLCWYVLQVQSLFEKRVKEFLENQVASQALSDDFGEILVPTEEVVEMRSGKKRRSERKFFPGYVLIQMRMTEKMWYLVRHAPRVHGFIGGTNEKPAPISQEEVEAITNRVEDGIQKPQPKTLFEAGEVVRVTDGPFADFNGVVEEVNYDKSRVRVAVMIFGRSTPVELSFDQIEKE